MGSEIQSLTTAWLLSLTYGHDEQRSDVEEAKVDHVEYFRVVDAAVGHTDRLGGARLVVLHGHRVDVDELGQRVDGRRDPHAHNDQLEGR